MRLSPSGLQFSAGHRLAVTTLVKPFRPRRAITTTAMSGSDAPQKLDKSTPDSVWKQVLSPTQYRILRQKGTEPPGSGEYNSITPGGIFHCAACDAPLYSSETKFSSGCGWPAFYDELPGTVERHEDVSMGMRRVEITCKNCGGHLGHVFEKEGFKTPTDERHCVNSVSLKFRPN
ncbi:MSRB1 [Auxenochlorella protothecoides x Auxenochlorella symbiontica]